MSDLKKVENSTGLAVKSQFSKEDILKYLDLYGLKNLTDNEKGQFIEICQLQNLNPFLREIHISKYGSNFSIITGYETYLKRAERNPSYAGYEISEVKPCKTATFNNKNELAWIDDAQITCTIFRKDREKPFSITVKLSEYAQKTNEGNVNKFWKKAETMLRKVATAQAHRLCFPVEYSGMPYIEEEADYIDITEKQSQKNVSRETSAKVENVPSATPTENKPTAKKALKSTDLKAWETAVNYLYDKVNAGSPIDTEIETLKKMREISEEDTEILKEAVINKAFEQKADISENTEIVGNSDFL